MYPSQNLSMKIKKALNINNNDLKIYNKLNIYHIKEVQKYSRSFLNLFLIYKSVHLSFQISDKIRIIH